MVFMCMQHILQIRFNHQRSLQSFKQTFILMGRNEGNARSQPLSIEKEAVTLREGRILSVITDTLKSSLAVWIREI